MIAIQRNPANVYQMGAADGLGLGLYFTVAFVLQMSLFKSALLGLLGELMLLAVPFIAYAIMRSGLKAAKWRSTFSAVWMHGIMMFLCGSLILGITSYAYLRFVNTTCIAESFRFAADFYLSQPEAELRQMGQMLENTIKHNGLPTPISLSFGLMWLGSFSGAMLSLLEAMLLKLLAKRYVNNNKQE